MAADLLWGDATILATGPNHHVEVEGQDLLTGMGDCQGHHIHQWDATTHPTIQGHQWGEGATIHQTIQGLQWVEEGHLRHTDYHHVFALLHALHDLKDLQALHSLGDLQALRVLEDLQPLHGLEDFQVLHGLDDLQVLQDIIDLQALHDVEDLQATHPPHQDRIFTGNLVCVNGSLVFGDRNAW